MAPIVSAARRIAADYPLVPLPFIVCCLETGGEELARADAAEWTRVNGQRFRDFMAAEDARQAASEVAAC